RRLNRRRATDFPFLNADTLRRAIDFNSDNDRPLTLTDIFHPEYNRGPADYDVRHTLSSTWIYELPWAAQRPWGGWQVNGLLYIRSGLPVNVTQTQNMLSTGVTNRPNTL